MNKPINIKDVKECCIVIKEKDIFQPDKKITKIRKAKDGVYCHFEYKENSFIVLEDLSGLGKCFSTSLGEFFLKDYGKTWALTEEELSQ